MTFPRFPNPRGKGNYISITCAHSSIRIKKQRSSVTSQPIPGPCWSHEDVVFRSLPVTLVSSHSMGLHPQHSTNPFNPPPRDPRAWGSPDMSCSRPRWQKTQASPLGLSRKGLWEGENIGVDESLHIIGFPTVHRTKRKRRTISDDYKTNLNYARSINLSSMKRHGNTITSDRLEKQNHHMEW